MVRLPRVRPGQLRHRHDRHRGRRAGRPADADPADHRPQARPLAQGRPQPGRNRGRVVGLATAALTATRFAPASTAWAMLSALIPPMTNAGSVVSRRRLADELQPGQFGEVLGPRRKRRPDADVAGPVEDRRRTCSAVCVLTPIRRAGTRIRRASLTLMSSWPRCTPSASTSRAMSGRSLTMNSVPVSRVHRRMFRARSSSSRSGRVFSRSWNTSAPPAAAWRIVQSSAACARGPGQQDVQAGLLQPDADVGPDADSPFERIRPIANRLQTRHELRGHDLAELLQAPQRFLEPFAVDPGHVRGRSADHFSRRRDPGPHVELRLAASSRRDARHLAERPANSCRRPFNSSVSVASSRTKRRSRRVPAWPRGPGWRWRHPRAADTTSAGSRISSGSPTASGGSSAGRVSRSTCTPAARRGT